MAPMEFKAGALGVLFADVQPSDIISRGVVVRIRGDRALGKSHRLHWAVSESGSNWLPPPHGWVTRPDVSYDAGGGAWQTPFEDGQVAIHFGKNVFDLKGLVFVVTDTAHGEWFKGPNGDLFVPVKPPKIGSEAKKSREPNGEKQPEDLKASTGLDARPEQLETKPLEREVAANDERRDAEKAKEPDHNGHDVATVPNVVERSAWSAADLMRENRTTPGVHATAINFIANAEPKAERSLMHRFDLVSSFLDTFGSDHGALVALAIWVRLCASRRLQWNRNYNVKPREISRAQNRAAEKLVNLFGEDLAAFDPLRLALVSVGRGGSSEMGQSIREEILIIQRANNCKGGMMEEWHQKLHNNSSPDDIAICKALIGFLDTDGDVTAYWKLLEKDGVDDARLRSYDRAIRSEPEKKLVESPGLRNDLVRFLGILRAVHEGHDLDAASQKVVGYTSQSRKAQVVYPGVSGIDTARIQELLLVIKKQSDLKLRLKAVLEMRNQVYVSTRKAEQERKIDLMFLDLALETTARTLIEEHVSAIRVLDHGSLSILALALENSARSTGHNKDLLLAHSMLEACVSNWEEHSNDSVLRLYAAVDRIKAALIDHSGRFNTSYEATAKVMCSALGIPGADTTDLFLEETFRNSPLSTVSLVLAAITPSLRKAAGRGDWELLSSFVAEGRIVRKRGLLEVEGQRFAEPTIVVVDELLGNEDLPQGCSGVIVLDGGTSPDLLSHVAVRARNDKVLLASCYDASISNNLAIATRASIRPSKDGQMISIKTS